MGRKSSPSLETQERGWTWQKTSSNKQGRGSGGQNQPSLTRNERERVGGRKHPPTHVSSEGGAVVGRTSSLLLETRERGWTWQKTPSDLCFKQGKGSGGRISPPLLKMREEGWAWQETPSDLCFKQGRGSGGCVSR